MTKNFPNLARDINIHIQEAEKTPYRMNPKNYMPKQIIIQLLSTKDKENFESSQRKMTPYLQEKNSSFDNSNKISYQKTRRQKEVAQYFSSDERKEPSTQNSIASENNLEG